LFSSNTREAGHGIGFFAVKDIILAMFAGDFFTLNAGVWSEFSQ
jgi:hypothetical protein